jgi:2-dehydro-3-deoxygluconokinase
MTKAACIGECMIELRQAPGGLFSRGFGGDTLNTAVYLSRLGIPTDYITALGDDSLSEEMISGWQSEGVGTSKVARLEGKLPGIYMIETDAGGERKFFHWRESAAARQLMSLPATDDILQSLRGYTLVYLSAITLSIYDEVGRARLFAALKDVRVRGVRVAFDTNFRARGWPDLEVARRVFTQAFETADIALASTEDLLPLWPGEANEALLTRIPSAEAVLKLDEPRCIVRADRATKEVRAEPVTRPVVDTTAAGDSFAAAYIAARLNGADPVAAARAGHRLAGVVVCYPGAIIPSSAMPPSGSPASRKASK